MSIAKSLLVTTFTNYVKDFQTKINTIKSEIASGKNTLTANQQNTVATLSEKVKTYSTPQASITTAKNTISVAQTAITSIQKLMSQMQQIATQATNPRLSSFDSVNMNFRFQQLVTEVGKLATSASLNGTNLLSGSAGMNVITGTDKTAASRSFVNSVDIYGMMTTGLLSNIKLDSPSNAQSAMWALNSALAQITSGQASLKATTNRLIVQETKLSDLSKTTQKSIDTLQKVDIAKLNTQLTQLQSQQNISYQVISQLDSTAYKNLKILALTSSS
jgi:flagellin-like hook-associated protein FlgL